MEEKAKLLTPEMGINHQRAQIRAWRSLDAPKEDKSWSVVLSKQEMNNVMREVE